MIISAAFDRLIDQSLYLEVVNYVYVKRHYVFTSFRNTHVIQDLDSQTIVLRHIHAATLSIFTAQQWC